MRAARQPGGIVTSRRSRAPIDVVVADDHAVVRAGIRLFLELEKDMRVVAEAADGRQAMHAIATFKPAVAVLDIHMPSASGIDVTRWVRSHVPATGVLVLSGYDDEPSVRAALEAGANGFLTKSTDGAEIVRAVREVNEGRAVLDPRVTRAVMRAVASRSDPAAQRPTERELEILRLVARGQTNKSIGYSLGISDRTVQSHLARICGKLNAASRTEAVMRAVFLGWVTTDAGRASQE
jgi:NarL family two-component system response regulator LiaR